MYKPVLLPLAKQDIKEAATWYNSRRKGLGKRFTSQIRKKVNFISQNPRAVAIRYDNIRTAVLDVFPYMIHYSIDENEKLVIIAAVLHTSQDPGLWEQRK